MLSLLIFLLIHVDPPNLCSETVTKKPMGCFYDLTVTHFMYISWMHNLCTAILPWRRPERGPKYWLRINGLISKNSAYQYRTETAFQVLSPSLHLSINTWHPIRDHAASDPHHPRPVWSSPSIITGLTALSPCIHHWIRVSWEPPSSFDYLNTPSCP